MRQYALIFVFGLFGCANPSHEKDIKTLDSLRTEVSKLEADFRSVDTTLTTEIKEEVTNRMNVLKSVFMPDSINANTAGKIAYYQSFWKEDARFRL
ncbi:MAG TPA: hypothetical protein VD905_04785, partial [Flavobacteriales bacterium]|nr:hypothetical protein [Flavobacteriales bacterium]